MMPWAIRIPSVGGILGITLPGVPVRYRCDTTGPVSCSCRRQSPAVHAASEVDFFVAGLHDHSVPQMHVACTSSCCSNELELTQPRDSSGVRQLCRLQPLSNRKLFDVSQNLPRAWQTADRDFQHPPAGFDMHNVDFARKLVTRAVDRFALQSQSALSFASRRRFPSSEVERAPAIAAPPVRLTAD